MLKKFFNLFNARMLPTTAAIFVIAALVPLLVLAGSGIVRSLFGLSITTALFSLIPPSLILALALFVVLHNFLTNRAQIIFWTLFLASACVFTWLQLFNEDFQGFPGLSCSDSANHLALRTRFISGDPAAYQGFVALYALSYWLENLYAQHSFFSWRDSFYWSLFATFVALALIGYRICRQEALRRIELFLLIILTSATVAVLHWIVLPIINYHQVDGFFPHVFALLPLVLIWTGYVLINPLLWRFLFLFAGIVFFRFTYGLNLPDLLATTAALLVIDAAGHSKKYHLLMWGLALCILGAAFYGYWRLSPIMTMMGSVARIKLDLLTATLFIYSALILGLTVMVKKTAWWNSCARMFDLSALARLVYFPTIFTLFGTIALTVFRQLGYTANYYSFKYLVHGTIIIAYLSIFILFLLFAFPLLINKTQSKILTRRLIWGSVSLLLFNVLFCGAMVLCHRHLWLPYVERFSRLDVYRHLRPVTDLEGERVIRKILRLQGKKFGGYQIEHWPRYSYVNTSLGQSRSDLDYKKGTFQKAPGYCVFWAHPQRKRIMDSHQAHEALISVKKIQLEGAYRVYAYTRSEGRPKPKQIGYKCY